jgi:glyoxylase-like metal-dependent hydrolase (beta-lactamase superfamily II)
MNTPTRSDRSISRRHLMQWMALAPVALTLSRWQGLALADTTMPSTEEPPRDPGFTTSAVTSTDLGHGLVVLAGPGGNITVLSAGENSLVIDSGIAPRAADVLKAVSAAAGGTVPKNLINTHYHFDHVGGNALLASSGATNRIAHAKTLQHMGETIHVDLMHMDFPPAPAEGRPTTTFDATFEINGAKLTRLDPAHTDGDVIIQFPDANVLVAGDVFFNGFYPFIDYATNGSLAGMIAATQAVLGMVDDQTQIVPGHGPVAKKPDLQAFHDMLVTARDTLTPLIKQGMSLHDVQAAHPLAALDPKWGQRLFHSSNFIHLVYDELKA